MGTHPKLIDGLPIFNATRPVIIHITEGDINKATKKETNSCAVAKACIRELHAKEVRVHLTRVYIRSNTMNWVRYLTPARLKSEIIAFDRGGKFVPGEFKLPKPPANYASGKQTGSKTNQNIKGKKGKHRAYHVTRDVRFGAA